MYFRICCQSLQPKLFHKAHSLININALSWRKQARVTNIFPTLKYDILFNVFISWKTGIIMIFIFYIGGSWGSRKWNNLLKEVNTPVSNKNSYFFHISSHLSWNSNSAEPNPTTQGEERVQKLQHMCYLKKIYIIRNILSFGYLIIIKYFGDRFRNEENFSSFTSNHK